MIKYEVTVADTGTIEWRLNGELHREDGPAVTAPSGYKAWWLNGKIHREDGPAYIGTKGTKAWWLNGKRHRTDGPAIIGYDGVKEWHLNGVKVTEAEVMGHKITIDGKEVNISAESYKALKESINV